MQTTVKRRLMGLCPKCGLVPPATGFSTCESCRQKIKEAYHRNPKDQRSSYKKYQEKLRNEAINAYGGKCITCGYNNPIGLLLHHGNHDGGNKRREEGIGRGRVFYKKLRDDGYPQDLGLEVMCGTCHLIHHRG